MDYFADPFPTEQLVYPEMTIPRNHLRYSRRAGVSPCFFVASSHMTAWPAMILR